MRRHALWEAASSTYALPAGGNRTAPAVRITTMRCGDRTVEASGPTIATVRRGSAPNVHSVASKNAMRSRMSPILVVQSRTDDTGNLRQLHQWRVGHRTHV